MKRTFQAILGVCASLLLMVTATGCSSSEIKYLAINQLVGFATAITSAASTSLLQSVLGGTAAQ